MLWGWDGWGRNWIIELKKMIKTEENWKQFYLMSILLKLTMHFSFYFHSFIHSCNRFFTHWPLRIHTHMYACDTIGRWYWMRDWNWLVESKLCYAMYIWLRLAWELSESVGQWIVCVLMNADANRRTDVGIIISISTSIQIGFVHYLIIFNLLFFLLLNGIQIYGWLFWYEYCLFSIFSHVNWLWLR